MYCTQTTISHPQRPYRPPFYWTYPCNENTGLVMHGLTIVSLSHIYKPYSSLTWTRTDDGNLYDSVKSVDPRSFQTICSAFLLSALVTVILFAPLLNHVWWLKILQIRSALLFSLIRIDAGRSGGEVLTLVLTQQVKEGRASCQKIICKEPRDSPALMWSSNH